MTRSMSIRTEWIFAKHKLAWTVANQLGSRLPLNDMLTDFYQDVLHQISEQILEKRFEQGSDGT